MDDLNAIVDSLHGCGLARIPPIVLLTRWYALLSGETPLFLDAALASGSHVPGTRYTFLALTETAFCYLEAQHDADHWSYDPQQISPRVQQITPRTLVAWRRPLSAVTEISLSDDAWLWLPRASTANIPTPAYLVTVAGDTIGIPLPSDRQRPSQPDPGPAIRKITNAWATRN